MGEDALHEFGLGRLEIHCDDEALDQFGDFSANQMRTKQFTGLRIEDRLDQPLGFTERNRLAIPDEGKAPNLDFAPAFLGIGLGQPDTRNLGAAIGTTRNPFFLHRMKILFARDPFGTENTFVRRLVRQPGGARHVPDCIDVGLACFHPLVGHDMRAVYLDTGSFETEALDVADDANGENDPVEGLRFRLTPFGGNRR